MVAARIASCPNCGAEVEFKAGTSLLAICAYCQSAVARIGGDVGELEILGKVAPLADLGSPLSLGLRGEYKKRGFMLIGRLQLDYGLGPWNEWYAAFEDGTWGWVAEAQGNVYLTFAREVEGLPSFAQARVGATFTAAGMTLTIVERRKARFLAAEGELPVAVAPGEEMRYCDLHGPGEVFGTIDYGSGEIAEALFLGEELDYADLFDPSDLKDRPSDKSTAAGAVGMNCPNCGAAVALRAPDDAQRVTCSACDAILDCGKGNQLFLLQSQKREGPEPRIALGSIGRFDGVAWTVYGHLVRSVTIDGVKYYWEEYLLRAEGRGYRWLVVSDNHWSWVGAIHAGDVRGQGLTMIYRGRRFRQFQSASARVEHIRGEFYWKVSVGERVGTVDYVDPPSVISREMSADEVNWSFGEYQRKEEIEAAFGLKKPLPEPLGVAPNQPNPFNELVRIGTRIGAVLSAVLLLLGAIAALGSANRVVLEKRYAIAAKESAQGAILTEPFELTKHTNLMIHVAADLKGGWMFLDGELVGQAGEPSERFGIGPFYSLGQDFEALSSEGEARSREIYLGSIAPGSYALRLTAELGPGTPAPLEAEIEARAGVFLPSHLFVALVLIWLFPLYALVSTYSFEKRRWAESVSAS